MTNDELIELIDELPKETEWVTGTIQNTGSRTKSIWILLNEKSGKTFNNVEAKN